MLRGHQILGLVLMLITMVKFTYVIIFVQLQNCFLLESISTEELDEMCPLIDEIKSSRIINCRKLGYLKTFKKSFYGNDLIDWLVAKKSLGRSCNKQLLLR